jgi:toxin ParE1/3/4
MARVVKSREAATDLIKLFVFFGKHSISLADRFLEAAEDACLRLAEMPEIGNLCESNHPALRGLRLWPIKRFRKYLILYRPLTDGIEVLRVLHGARDIESLFER